MLRAAADSDLNPAPHITAGSSLVAVAGLPQLDMLIGQFKFPSAFGFAAFTADSWNPRIGRCTLNDVGCPWSAVEPDRVPVPPPQQRNLKRSCVSRR